MKGLFLITAIALSCGLLIIYLAKKKKTSSPRKRKQIFHPIRTLDDLESLETINGLSLKEIETRARPIDDNTTDPQNWKYRSFDGFLGHDEFFKQIIREDFHTLQKLGSNADMMSECLKKIILIVQEKRTQENLGMMTPVTIDFTFENLGFKTFPTQKLTVTRQMFSGFQYSLFWNEDPLENELNTSWNEDFVIENTTNHLKVKVAGNEQVGLVDYIHRFGFFEGGGVRNEYRIFPELLWTVLTGICSQETIEIVKKTDALKMKSLEDELEECRSYMETQELDALKWSQANEKKIQSDILNLQMESQQLISTLEMISLQYASDDI